MKKLIILNQQPFIPAFMLTAISCAKESFDDICYINTCNPNNRKDVDKNARVGFLHPGRGASFLALVKAVFGLLSPMLFKDIKKCIKDKGLSFSTIKQFIVEQYVHQRLFPLARKTIKASRNPENITVLSTWFAASAFTAARIKEAIPSIKAVSLAHSYEILSIRNPYVKYMHYTYKHNRLDGVFFISHIIREMYFDGIGGLPEELKQKTFVSYLGSIKESNRINTIKSGTFNIVTCSRLVPLKRIDLLMDAIADWDICPIKWTHLGDGPLFTTIRERAKELCEKSQLVNIEFTGRVSNEKVKRFYAENPVDLFVNLSEIEGLPISIMEAISYGIPVLATDVGGTREIVVPETGFLISPNVTKEVVRKSLVDYLNQSDSRKYSLRESAYQYWNKHFNASKNFKYLFEEIEGIPS